MSSDTPTQGVSRDAPQAQPATIRRQRPDLGAAPVGQVSAGAGDLTDELLRSDQWTDAMVQAAGISITDVPFVSIGGGIGSFVTVDYLRIAGVAPDRIAVLSNIDFPDRKSTRLNSS